MVTAAKAVFDFQISNKPLMAAEIVSCIKIFSFTSHSKVRTDFFPYSVIKDFFLSFKRQCMKDESLQCVPTFTA